MFDAIRDCEPHFVLPGSTTAESAVAWIQALHALYMAQADDSAELAEHRAAYKLIQEAGFFEPEELLSRHVTLSARNADLLCQLDNALDEQGEDTADIEHLAGRVRYLTEELETAKGQIKRQAETITSYQGTIAVIRQSVGVSE